MILWKAHSNFVIFELMLLQHLEMSCSNLEKKICQDRGKISPLCFLKIDLKNEKYVHYVPKMEYGLENTINIVLL